MRISKKLILRVAYEIAEEREEFTQYDVHDRIEERLRRPLTISEKRRITQILRREFIPVRRERNRNEYRTYTHFIL